MTEFNPMAELGLTHDKQLICSCIGFMTQNDCTRDLCERYIPKGGKFYDLMVRYDMISAYVLNRQDSRAGGYLRHIVPFLKAFGATDHDMHKFCMDSFHLMPGIEHTMHYLNNLLPTFISTSSFEHTALGLSERLDLPIMMFDSTRVDLDQTDMPRRDGKTLREVANEIVKLKVPTVRYESGVQQYLDDTDVKMMTLLDGVMNSGIQDTEASPMMKNMRSVGVNEKAYALLDLRKRMNIDLDGTAFIGGDNLDYHALDLVRDGGGLALSFNGSELAIRGCNIAAMTRDTTVASVLVQEFYHKGMEAVFDLVSNWDRESLKKRDFPDPNVMNRMLEENARKLPEVRIVDKQNLDEIIVKSEQYRKKLLMSY